MVVDHQELADSLYTEVGREWRLDKQLTALNAIQRILSDQDVTDISDGGVYKQGDGEYLERYFITFGEDTDSTEHMLFRETNSTTGQGNDKFILYET